MMVNQQQKLIALAGASAALVLCFGFYFLMRKRSKDGERHEDVAAEEEEARKVGEEEAQLDFADLNERESESASAAQTVVEVKVPSYVVGSIIGKGGSNIKQLKSEFGVRFDFEREDSSDLTRQKLDRTLTIRGQRDKVQAAEQKIKDIIVTTPKYVETDIFVPQSACGRIIGKGGQNIREMQSVSGAKIVVDRSETNDFNYERKVSLSGTTVQVEYAKLLIEEKVETEKAFRLKDAQKEKGKRHISSCWRQCPGCQTKSNSSSFLKDFPMLELCEDGYFQVFVSAIDTPEHFWVQPVTSQSVKLDEMTKALTMHYSTLKHNEERLEEGKSGSLCVSSFEEDNDWYRACITSILPNATVTVFYFDFGDSRNVHVNELKTIKSEFLELPAQAVECYLPVKPQSNYGWSQDHVEEFSSLTHCAQWIPLMAKVIGYKQIDGRKFPMLQLIDTSNNEDQDVDIMKALISKNFVVQSDEDIDFVKLADSSEKTFPNNTTKIPTQVEETIATEVNEIMKFQSLHDDHVDAPNEMSEFLRNNPQADTSLNQTVLFEDEEKLKKVEDENKIFSTVVHEDHCYPISKKDEKDEFNVINKKILSEENRQQSTESDGFIDIDVRTIDGAITAVVSEHVPTAPLKDEQNVQASSVEDIIEVVGNQELQASPVNDDSEALVSEQQVQANLNEDNMPALISDEQIVRASVVENTTEMISEQKVQTSPIKDSNTENDVPNDDIVVTSSEILETKDETYHLENEQIVSEDEKTLIEEENFKDDQTSELQKSLDETSRKNVFISSMELARENLITASDTSLNDSFFSARSEITITDTDDTTSFLSAQERLTPTNDLSFSLPDINIESDPTNITPKASPNVKRLSGSMFEIQFIDEKTHEVLSRESRELELTEPKKVGKETSV